MFQIGCFAQRLTLHAQQIRAYNLVWALIETSSISPGDKIGIVGAGLAGLTAAGACNAFGCDVTLYEQYADVLHLQRGNRLRYLHPNVYDWPAHEVDDRKTRHLPFLSWTAGFCDEVAREILDQWRMLENRISLRNHSKVIAIRPNLNCVELDVETNDVSKEVHSIVILCVGYGYEKTLLDTQRLSYWQNDSLCQPAFFQAKKHILVTGCGDGGLTDALRLTLKDFNHARFILDIGITFSQELRAELIRIDDAAYELWHTAIHCNGVNTDQAERECRMFLDAEYQKLTLPPGLTAYIQRNRRHDTKVVLNNTGPKAMTLEASPINRFAVHCLMQAGLIGYIPGKPAIKRNRTGSYQVRFGELSSGQQEEIFDDIVVRQGIEPVISHLIETADFDRLRSNALKDRNDLTRVVHFPGRQFLRNEFDSIRASFSESDAIWYQVDFLADTGKCSQADHIAKSKSLLRHVCEQIGATLSDYNDYESVSDKSHRFDYRLEKEQASVTWTVSINRSETTKAGNVPEVSYQLITYFKSSSKALVDLILNLELLPYDRYVMGVSAGTFYALDEHCSIRFRDLSIRGELDSFAQGANIELTCPRGMYHAHTCISVKHCVTLLNNRASGIVLDLYNKIISKRANYVEDAQNGHLPIPPNAYASWEWNARDVLP